jgi:hypothetical protein
MDIVTETLIKLISWKKHFDLIKRGPGIKQDLKLEKIAKNAKQKNLIIIRRSF